MPCLDEEQICRLAKLGKMLELHFGCPQDFEWAVDSTLPLSDNIVILQSRPVTTVSVRKSPVDLIIDELVTRSLRKGRG